MSEQDESGERTELPTEKRRREAREQGNIPRSRELATAAVFGAGVLAIIAMGPSLARNALGWMKIALTPDAALMRQPDQLFGHVGLLLLKLLAVIAPVAGICVLAGLVAPVAMSGLQFSQKALMPDLKRLSPAAGLKRLQMHERIRYEFDTDTMLPAAGQGALGIEIRADRQDLVELFAGMAHSRTWQTVTAERAVSRCMGGSCSMPLAAHGEWQGNRLHLRAAWGDEQQPDAALVRAAASATVTDLASADALGQEVAQQLQAAGAQVRR